MNQGSTPRLLEGCSGDWFIPYIFSLKNVLWCKTRSDTLSKMIQGCTIAYNTLKGQLETKQASTYVYPRTNGLTIASCDSKNINNSWQWLVISKGRVQKLKGDVDIRDCEAFLAVIFFKNAQTFWFFDIVGGMCASLRCQSFKAQLRLLPGLLLQPTLILSISWHMRTWPLSYPKIIKYSISWS